MSFHYYQAFSVMLFVIGFTGILIKRHHLISFLISLELMILAANTHFLAKSAFLHDIEGAVFVFFSMTVAAAEAALGLALLVLLFRKHQSVNINIIEYLKD